MKIKTTRFGTIRVTKDKIIHMPFGMLGFSENKQFIMFRHKENSPFFWYQSVDDPALAFVITSPFMFMPDYKIDDDEVIKAMSWDNIGDDDLELYVVANIPKGKPEEMTANLIGPVLINIKNRQAVQMVISNTDYSHRFPIVV
ncbi:flagellar assembly protein FliW [Desulfobacterium sp. N47]|uniref:Flagellar assembly factor FliW n=1 Tax=uncultured Desulfobacterium sp. TaxID=201089 RepID=E1YHN6_9BACT|nr:Flagellar assembly factor fliW [uncultured Desulfobacterium sp.]